MFPQDHIDKSKLLPSRFVLTKKADPKNCSPLDSQIEDAKLKARWEVAGHLDTEAGLWETEAPTASLMAHNLLAFLRRSSGGRCFFGDISAAFLQGENLDPQRVVLVAIPKGYPDFVQQFLATKLPPGACLDMVQFIKGGFGLAETPRLWFTLMGARECALIPGVFSFFHEGKVIAMLACHVDDIRLIGHPEEAIPVWEKLKAEFTFGEWRDAQGDWVKFCGWYERQTED